METYCNSEYDESPDVSVEDEEEEEDEPQEGQPLTNSSLKILNQSSGKGKAKSPDEMDIVQSEDTGLTWETSSSRCSTSQASETSATSGVYSMDNSYIDSPPGKVMEDGKAAQKTSNSLDQMPSFPNQNAGTGSKKEKFSGSPMQVTVPAKELDPADPHSWPFQVQPSKIKDYLVQITQDVESPLLEEKENNLKKKGELPLKGTVRARIEQITAVLEERNKKIFRRVNGKDLPSSGTSKPKEPPRIFSRQSISVSLRHIERDTRDKNNKKEILRYNLKPVQTNISKPGVPSSYKKDERKTKKSVLPETLNKEKSSPVLSTLNDKVNKLGKESYLPVIQTSVSEHTRFAPPDHQDKMMGKAKKSFVPDPADVMSEKSSSLAGETEKQTMAQCLPMAPEVPPISEALTPTPERETPRPCSPISVIPPAYSANEAENQTEPTVGVLSESSAQYPNIMKPEAVPQEHEHSLPAEIASQDIELHLSPLEIKDSALLHSAEESGKQVIPPYSPAESLPEEGGPPCYVIEPEKQVMKPLEVEYLKADAQKQPTAMLETELDHLHAIPSVEESVTGQVEISPDLSSTDRRTEIQEHQSVEEHFGLPHISHLTGETEKEETKQLQLNLEKQGVLTQTPVTALLQPEFQEVSYPRDKAENQTVQLETQPLELSLPIPTPQSEEVHRHAVAVVQSESEQPVISEPIKTLQGTAYTEPSLLGDIEACVHLPTEMCNETSEQLLSISSLLTDNVEKQETRPSSLAIAVPQSEQTNSVLPYTAEQMETQDNRLCSSEKATLISEVPLPAVAVQNADATKLEMQPDSTTKAPSEKSASISRESVVAENKTIQPDLPLSAEPPPEASVRLQEVAELENRVSPSIKTNLYSEVLDASHHIGEECQEKGHHLFTTTRLEMKHSVATETENQTIKTNDSIPSQLEMEATIALSCFDETENKIVHKPLAEPSYLDSLGPVHVPEKQERVQLEMEPAAQLLSSTSLQKQSNVSLSVEEIAINGLQLDSPASAEDLSETVCSAEPQDSVDFSTGPVAPDLGLLYTPDSVNDAMTRDTVMPESERVAKQPVQAATAESEPSYVQVPQSVSESMKHFDVPSAVLSAEEGDRFVTPRSDHDHLILLDIEGKEAECYSPVTPASTASPEPQGGQRDSSNEASKQPPMISSFFLGDTQSVVSSVPTPEQSFPLLSDHNKKAEKEENQSLSSEKPETVPEEPVSITAFLKGETKGELLHSSGIVKIVPEESKSIPEDFASEAVKEIATSFSPVSEEYLSNETFLPFVVDAGEDQAWSHSLLTDESKQPAADKADAQDDQSPLLATTQSERRNEDVKLYCPVTAQLELEDRELLDSNEGISKQGIPPYLLSTVQSAPVHQELLYDKEERDNQQRVALEAEQSKSLQSPIWQQEPEHRDVLQPIKEMEAEAIQLYSSAAVQDLSQPAGEKGTLEFQGYLPKTAEMDLGFSKSPESMDEAEQKENQLPRPEAEELDYKHLASSFLAEIVEKQVICSHSPEASMSVMLEQSNSAVDFTEKDKNSKVQPCPETLATEEPLSIAAFLLSEAKEMLTSFPKTAEEEDLDTQFPFKEPDLLVEGSKNGSTWTPETNSGSAWTSETDITIKREIQPSQTQFVTKKLSHELQAEVTDQDNRENTCNIPTIPNLILNESSDIVLQEPMNDTHPWSANSDKTPSKDIVISTKNISKSEDIKNLPQANITWKEPANDLQKEKELKDNEKPREDSIATPELDQGKDAPNSEDHVNIHIPPLVPSVDKEKDMHVPEKFKYLETISSLQTESFHLVEHSVADQRTSTCKPGTKTSDSLKTANLENKETELKALVRETDVWGSINNEKEILTIPENKNDGILNAIGLDYFGKHTVTDNSSFTQTGKEQSVPGMQRPVDITKENAEETTSPAASLENILVFSLLESKLDETFNGAIRKENVTTTHQDISKVLNEDNLLDSVKKNDKHIEEELNLVDVPLFNAEKGMLPQPPLTPLPNTAVNPELVAGQLAAASLNRDLYEKAEEGSCKHPPDENIKNTDVPFHRKSDAPDDEITTYFERGISKDGSPNNLEDSQTEKVLKEQHVKEEPRVLQGAYESNQKEEPRELQGVCELNQKEEPRVLQGACELNQKEEPRVLQGARESNQKEEPRVLQGACESNQKEEPRVLQGAYESNQKEEPRVLQGACESNQKEEPRVLQGAHESNQKEEPRVLQGACESNQKEEPRVLQGACESNQKEEPRVLQGAHESNQKEEPRVLQGACESNQKEEPRVLQGAYESNQKEEPRVFQGACESNQKEEPRVLQGAYESNQKEEPRVFQGACESNQKEEPRVLQGAHESNQKEEPRVLQGAWESNQKEEPRVLQGACESNQKEEPRVLQGACESNQKEEPRVLQGAHESNQKEEPRVLQGAWESNQKEEPRVLQGACESNKKEEPRVFQGACESNQKEEPRVLQGAYESNQKECEPVCILAEATAQVGLLSPKEIVKGMNDGLIEGPAEIVSDVKAVTCKPTHAIPFGGGFYRSGATSDDISQDRIEESSSSETSQMLPEETSDEESSPILDYAATVYQKEASVQEDVTCSATDQTQQSEITEGEVDNYVVRKPVEEGAPFHETFHHVSPQSEGPLEEPFVSVLEPGAQCMYALDHEHLSSWDLEEQTYEKSVGENFASNLAKHSREDVNQQLSASEAKSDKTFGEFDFTLLSHDFESYPLYSIKEEEYSDDEDLAELMEYEMVTRDDVFQEETPSEVAREELLFDDRKSLDRISDSYEFVNEKEANAYAEEEELMGIEKLPKSAPVSEVLQRKTELAELDTYCCECKCPISDDDKIWGEHKDHSVTSLETGVTELKGQLDGFLDVLQERSLKIEGFVSEIETLFNTLEENCKGKEQLLEQQNESIVKTVLEHHDQKAQRFEEIKNTKMEYLYEQMVNFQEYIDTAKETLETIIKETEEMDDFVFLRSSEEINKRLLSAVEDILTLEKMPAAFSHFEHFAGNSASGDWNLEHVPVPQTPKLQPQEPNSATSTSIAVYWTVSEEDIIDFFQVYCVEEHPGRQEQSGLVEEYRVTVKESNCILEDLEPGYCYSVWIMAVNYTGCSFPSEKSTFRTAPPTPVIKAEDCTVCWDTATIRWSTGNPGATDSFTLEYCRQYSPQGEGLRSLAGIKRPELKVTLEPNINYFFYVRAVNVFGTSEQSEAALISTKGTRFHILKETAPPAMQVSPSGASICLPKETHITGLIYKVLHNGEMSDVIVTEQPARVGILLDYNAGRLLFFNAERGQVLFAIRQKFTAAIHPAFGLEQPGILHLHTGMELPEFVKYS